MPVTNFDGTTAAEWLAKLRKRIENQRTTGPKYAHEILVKAREAEWVSEKVENGCERRYFVAHQGADKDGNVKRWHITCRELSEKHQKRTGKRWRIEASQIYPRTIY